MLTDSSVSFGSDLQDLLPEEYELEDAQYDGLEMGNFLPDSFALDPQRVSVPPGGLPPFHPDLQQIDPHSVNLIPNGLQPYERLFTYPNPPLTSPSQIDLQQYNPQPPIEHWTNHALLSILQDWQGVIYSGGEQYSLEHPDFQELIEELIERDLLNADWRWTVNIEEVNMAFSRAVVEGSRF